MKIIALIISLSLSYSLFSKQQDSIGTKTVNGVRYIMHKVTKGEGVYSISRKYHVTADEIYAYNENSAKGIQIDQVLLIPKGASTTNTHTPNTSVVKTEKIYHTITKGQTLTYIAKKYNTTIAKIKSWNNLSNDEIQLGEKIIVGEKKVTIITPSKPAETNPTPAPKTPVNNTTPELPIVNNTTGSTNPADLKISTSNEPQVINGAEAIKIADNTTPTPAVKPITNQYTVEDGDEVKENGLAIISTEGDLAQDRSFILHPTAKIGTIVMITNSDNNNAVFARVVGNFKPTDGTVLKMSKMVADKLGVTDNIKVTISYAK